MDISVIIPAYNEEKRIAFTLEKSIDFLQQRSWQYELLPVDDGSRDATVERIAEVAREFPQVRCVLNGQNRGKGYSIRHGLQEAQGNFIGFMDADYKTDIAALDHAMELLESGACGVIGDRTLGKSEIARERKRYREMGSIVFRRGLQMLMGLRGYDDTQCGFKFFRAEVMRDLFNRQKVEGYMFDVEILLLASKLGYALERIPVKWTFDPDSRFNPVTGMIRNLGELARIRWEHRGGF
ncbi:MAG: glycosyltransferase [Candidatus Latescibacterota bacterium]|nr:glycosyltransferase [Candidatus Latescibacterota bacterium]MEE2727714.1 glycosyltransferase [Candidatus Latescibacterota bacterium]